MKIKYFIILTLTFYFGIKVKSAEAQKIRPNILFIYMDDLGWTDVAAGSKYYETPNIDKLASEGIKFTQAYSCGPNCAPSRGSLMTGLYTPRHGIYTVGTAERGDSSLRRLIPVKNNTVLAPSFVTIAEELKNAGYSTGLIGKWQLGEKSQNTDPKSQGFDYVIGGAGGTKSYFYPYAMKKDLKPFEGIDSGREGEYLTDRLTDEALKFINTNKEKSFFLYLSYFAVHTPIQAKDSLVEKYKAKQGTEYHNNPTYAAMIESADEGVGRLLENLKRLNLDKNTLVIFYSDNGGYGGATYQYPLRGSKGMLYEGGVRVPLFVRWPGKIKAGGQSETPVIGVDFYSTLLEVANITKPLTKAKLDGQSFAPILFDKPYKTRDAIYWHFPAYLEGFSADKRSRDSFRTRPVSAVRSGDYKLLEFYEDKRVELYNIKEDIGETDNLAQKNPEKTKELYEKLDTWRKQVNAPIPTTANPWYVHQE
jgi:arylsulfatase A-like enzyme